MNHYNYPIKWQALLPPASFRSTKNELLCIFSESQTLLYLQAQVSFVCFKDFHIVFHLETCSCLELWPVECCYHMQSPLLKIQSNHEQTEIGKGKECAYGYYLKGGEPDMPNIAFFHLRFTTESHSLHWWAFSESPNETANVEAADTWKRDGSSCPTTWLLESLGTTTLLLFAQDKGGECINSINGFFKVQGFSPSMMCVPRAQVAETCELWGSVFLMKHPKSGQQDMAASWLVAEGVEQVPLGSLLESLDVLRSYFRLLGSCESPNCFPSIKKLISQNAKSTQEMSLFRISISFWHAGKGDHTGIRAMQRNLVRVLRQNVC